MLLHRNLPMSVDAMLELVRLRGLRLNNLFQLFDGRWQANVTDGEKYWEFGRGDTADAALQAALHIAATTEPEYSPPEPITVVRTTPRPTRTIVGKPISKL